MEYLRKSARKFGVVLKNAYLRKYSINKPHHVEPCEKIKRILDAELPFTMQKNDLPVPLLRAVP